MLFMSVQERGCRSPLLTALKLRDVDVVRALLEFKADPNAVDEVCTLSLTAPLSVVSACA
jgi:hypothetical protein